MHKYFDIELFGWNRIKKDWWNITILRVSSGNWSWHLFMMEENLDDISVDWFKFSMNK
tara:strand:+ start:737 stop:910 length:174 start_codon:yes stop_codon:yes gene_type:complete